MAGGAELAADGLGERLADEVAFAALYRREREAVVGYFRRRVRCPAAAAELTAETFARAWAGRDGFDPARGTAIGWTMGIAANLYREWCRTGAPAGALVPLDGPSTDADDLDRIEAQVDLAALRDRLRAGLGRLSPAVRDAVVLRVVLDLPYDEVAAVLGCSAGAARVRVSRGLDALVAAMDAGP